MADLIMFNPEIQKSLEKARAPLSKKESLSVYSFLNAFDQQTAKELYLWLYYLTVDATQELALEGEEIDYNITIQRVIALKPLGDELPEYIDACYYSLAKYCIAAMHKTNRNFAVYTHHNLMVAEDIQAQYAGDQKITPEAITQLASILRLGSKFVVSMSAQDNIEYN